MPGVTKQQRRRYYLHYRLRKRYRLSTPGRTIYIPYDEFTSIPEPFKRYCDELKALGYGIQSEIK